MFGMGFTEILLVGVVAIIALGPEKLPQAMVDIAKFFRAFKRTIDDAKQSIDREIQISELKQEAIAYKDSIQESIKDTKAQFDLSDALNDDSHPSPSLLNETSKLEGESMNTVLKTLDDDSFISQDVKQETSQIQEPCKEHTPSVKIDSKPKPVGFGAHKQES